MENLVLREIQKFGASCRIYDRLAPFGKTPMFGWALHRLRDTDDKIVTWLEFMAAKSNYAYSYSQLKYAYFSVTVTPLIELRKNREYNTVRSILEEAFGSRELWDELLPYVYRNAIKLCAELLFEKDTDARDVAAMLNISERLSYYLRKAYLEEKNNNDNKPNQ